MIGEILKLLPSYVIGGLFFSWLIWAYLFNDKSFKIDGKIESVILILKIFFTIFIVVVGFIYLFTMTLFILLRTNIDHVFNMLNDLPNNILLMFLILTFFFVMSTNKKDINKERIKEQFSKCCYMAYYVPAIFLGLTISSFFSSYRIFDTVLFFLITIMVVGLIFIFNIFGSQILEIKDGFRKYILKNKNILIIIWLISFLGTFILFYWMFPQINTQTKENHYLVYDESKIFLQKEVVHKVRDLGNNLFLSNWIPIYYDNLNLSDIKFYRYYIGGKCSIKIRYKNSSETPINLIDLIEKEPKDSILIKDDNRTNNLMIKTDNDAFRKDEVTNISLISYNKIKDEPNLVKNEPIPKEISGRSLFLVYNLSNNLNLPIIYKDFLLVNTGTIISNSSKCKLNKAEFKIYRNNKLIYNKKTNCDVKGCNIGKDKSINFDGGSIITEINQGGHYLIRLDTKELEHDSIKISMNITC